MRLTLKKNIQLYSAEAYLRFEKEEERKDIQEYLKGEKEFEPLIEKRIKDYLKNIGIYNENFQLTQKGNKAMEKGHIFVKEEGKYLIWFTQNDNFFNDKIFYFRRLQPNLKEKHLEKITLDKEHLLLPTENNKYSELNLLSKEICGEKNRTIENISFSWEWEGTEKSHYTFSGELKNGKETKTKIKADKILSDKNLEEYITKILPEWDNQNKRYRINFSCLEDKEKNEFRDEMYSSKWLDFEVEIQNLPLMPYDKEQANKWRDWLVEQELKKEYCNLSDFENKVNQVNKKEALSSFDMQVPDVGEFIAKMKPKSLGFWHLKAPMDLNPNKKSFILNSLSIKENDIISFATLVEKLGIQNYPTIVYYDQYLLKHWQQKAGYTFVKATKSDKNIIITNLEKMESYFLKNLKNVELVDLKNVFNENKPAHDRYLIALNKEKISVWSITNSIGWLYFSKDDLKNLDEKTVGRASQSVTFSLIKEQVLSDRLLTFIKTKTNNEN